MENERNIERYAGGRRPSLRFHDCRRFLMMTPFSPDKYTDFPLTSILHSPFSILNYSTFPLSTPQNMVH